MCHRSLLCFLSSASVADLLRVLLRVLDEGLGFIDDCVGRLLFLGTMQQYRLHASVRNHTVYSDMSVEPMTALLSDGGRHAGCSSPCSVTSSLQVQLIFFLWTLSSACGPVSLEGVGFQVFKVFILFHNE